MTPQELFGQGRLNDAIDAAATIIRSKPNDIDARGILSELYCYRGDFEKADSQLDTLQSLKPDLIVGVNVLRQLIRAETARMDFYKSGRVPDFLDKPSDELQLRLQASISIREQQPIRAREELDKAEQLTQQFHVTCSEQSQLEFRDLDDLTSSVFEIYSVTGKYLWIPMSSVMELQFSLRESIIDYCWSPVVLTLREKERDLQGYMPLLYSGSCSSESQDIQTGRATDWIGDENSPMRGIGQRMFLVGDNAVPVTSITTVSFQLI